MKRLFWVSVGAVGGIYAMRRVSRAAERLTPAGLAESLTGAVAELGESVRLFGVQVRAGMAEREIELRDALGLETPDNPRRDEH